MSGSNDPTNDVRPLLAGEGGGASHGVSGLRFGLGGAALETVRSKSSEFNLLAGGRGCELIEGCLQAGERLTLVPSDGAGGIEACYLLAGGLRCDLPAGAVDLVAGDYFSAAGLERPVIFTATDEARFLYVTSQPTFHEMSETVRELMRLAVEVEMKDGYTAEHCLRLQRLSFATGRVLGLDPHDLHLLDYGAYLHDVGKIRVPVEILQKPAKLDEDEWRLVRRHPTYGREMLDGTFMAEAGRIVEQHHERLDGSGYPNGIASDEIDTMAYIVAVADTYDAMTTDRSYRRALPAAEAFAELERHAGVHYPRDVVRAFRAAAREIEAGPAAGPA